MGITIEQQFNGKANYDLGKTVEGAVNNVSASVVQRSNSITSTPMGTSSTPEEMNLTLSEPTASPYAIEPHSRVALSPGERARRIELVGGGRGTESQQNRKMTDIEVPYWNGEEVKTMTLTVNKFLVPNVTSIFEQLAAIKWKVDPDTTGGYNYRTMRTSDTTLSDHSMGAAIDINWDNNYNTGDGSSMAVRQNEEVIRIFASQGFYWGGDWERNKDDMHFSFCGY